LGEAGIFAGAQTPHTLPRFRSAMTGDGMPAGAHFVTIDERFRAA
jgi:hypothetical protein